MSACAASYLLCQGATRPLMLITIFNTLTAPGYCYLLVFHLGLGVQGAAWALLLLTAQQATLLVSYTVVRLRGW